MNAINAIPEPKPLLGWKVRPIVECDESLVSMREVNHPLIMIQPMYYLVGVGGAVNDCFVREGVRDCLIKATSLLPNGYKLVLRDGWRSKETQQVLHEHAKSFIETEYPNLTLEERILYTDKYITYPTTNPINPFAQSTGGSIQVTLATADGEYLYMGTEIDEMNEKVESYYYERKVHEGDALSHKELATLVNRRLLYSIMTESGFTNYPAQWWHYNYGNQYWAKQTSNKAIYGLINL